MDTEKSSENCMGRPMRQKYRRVYGADELNDDDIDGKWSFDVNEKLASANFESVKFYIELKGSEVTVEYFRKNGFTAPILVKDKTGLGMRIPSENFTVKDVKRCVGSRRVLDVMDVTTQKGIEMSLKEWVKYYEDIEQHKTRLLNVISLEFSHTRLEDYVDQPRIVHELDWVDVVWPQFYKDLQTQSTNALNEMMYPKVQKYCLMSVGGCYTDFHIDMGGTSVWYHILRGKKVFWLVPPTDENLSLYISWTLSAKQGETFFGDVVKTCYRITLEAGWTFFIPTGWIHAVYTPEDSLVFGGNFLHSFGIQMQLCVADIEAKTHVPIKFRYPLFKELHWYVLERYVSCVLGIEHRVRSDQEINFENGYIDDEVETSLRREQAVGADVISCKPEPLIKPEGGCCKLEDTKPEDRYDDENAAFSLGCEDVEEIETTSVGENKSKLPIVNGGAGFSCLKLATDDGSVHSLNGYCCLDSKLTTLSEVKLQPVDEDVSKWRKKSFVSPSARAILAPIALTRMEIEGLMLIVSFLENLPASKKGVPKDLPDPEQLIRDARTLVEQHKFDDQDKAALGEIVLKWPVKPQPKRRKLKTGQTPASSKQNTTPTRPTSTEFRRRRRVRCQQCEPCTRPECRECTYCLDKPKFGGLGRLKQTCKSRGCLAPRLSSEACCDICGAGNSARAIEVLRVGGEMEDDEDWSHWLMECRVCWEIVHPACLRQRYPDCTHGGVLEEDFPSSWDCCRCSELGLVGRPRHLLSRPSTAAYREATRQSTSKPAPCYTDSPPIGWEFAKKSSLPDTLVHSQTLFAHNSSSQNPSVLLDKLLTSASKRSVSSSVDINNKEKKKLKASKKTKQSKSSISWTVSGCSGSEELPGIVRMNSRGREISLPRRYLV